jgi:uncharacterized membrane protein YbaN (DUF454 family)
MENPGQTLGIVGLVCNFLGVGVAGIILGVMSRNKSKQSGASTTLGTISLVWGIIATTLAVLWITIFMVAVIMSAAEASTSTEDSASDTAPVCTTSTEYGAPITTCN